MDMRRIKQDITLIQHFVQRWFCHQCNFTCDRENFKSTVCSTQIGALTFLDVTGGSKAREALDLKEVELNFPLD